MHLRIWVQEEGNDCIVETESPVKDTVVKEGEKGTRDAEREKRVGELGSSVMQGQSPAPGTRLPGSAARPLGDLGKSLL